MNYYCVTNFVFLWLFFSSVSSVANFSAPSSAFNWRSWPPFSIRVFCGGLFKGRHIRGLDVVGHSAIFYPSTFIGEMPEWSNGHDWKSCVGVTLPRVRIPLSPPQGRKPVVAPVGGRAPSPSSVVIPSPHSEPLCAFLPLNS